MPSPDFCREEKMDRQRSVKKMVKDSVKEYSSLSRHYCSRGGLLTHSGGEAGGGRKAIYRNRFTSTLTL
jgi:hypothetical protein